MNLFYYTLLFYFYIEHAFLNTFRFGHECLTTTLLDYGASPSVKNTDQRTPLHLSCLAGHIEVNNINIIIKPNRTHYYFQYYKKNSSKLFFN